MRQWTRNMRCNDPAYLNPKLVPKVAAVIADVQAHYDESRVRITLFETGRSVGMQRQYIKSGTSRIKDATKAPHVLGEAADIIPYIKVNGRWQPTWKPVVGDDGRTWTDYLTSSAQAHGLERVYFSGVVDGPHLQLPRKDWGW